MKEVDRPLRVFLEKKTGKYYVLNKKKKIYIQDYTKNKHNVQIINQIVNNLAGKRRQKKIKGQKATGIPHPLQNAINTQGNLGQRTAAPIMRNLTNPFDLLLPYNLQGRFNQYSELQDLSKKINEVTNKNNLLESEVKALKAPLPAEPKLAIEHKMENEDNVENQLQKHMDNKQMAIHNAPKKKGYLRAISDKVVSKVVDAFTPHPKKVTVVNVDDSDLDRPELDDDIDVNKNLTFHDSSSSDENKKLNPKEEILKAEEKILPKIVTQAELDAKEIAKEIDKTEELDKNMPKPTKPKRQSIIPVAKKEEEENKEIPNEEDFYDFGKTSLGQPHNPDKKGVQFSFEEFPEFKGKIPTGAGNSKPVILSYDQNGVRKIKIFDTKKDFFDVTGEKLVNDKYAPAVVFSNYQREKLENIMDKGSEGKVYKLGKTLEAPLIMAFGNGASKFVVGSAKNLKKFVKGGAGKLLKELASYRGKYNSPLYDSELVEMLAPYKNFEGVIMRDQLEYLLDKMEKEDKDKFGFVMNLDPSTEEGSHWVAIYVDLDDGKQVCYYDSFGRPIPKNVLLELKKFVKDRKLPYYVKFKNNRVVHQASSSNRCGYFCARFLIHMFKTQSFEQATDFDTIRESEKDAEKLEKQYKNFGYI